MQLARKVRAIRQNTVQVYREAKPKFCEILSVGYTPRTEWDKERTDPDKQKKWTGKQYLFA